jgi:hypothetical protein
MADNCYKLAGEYNDVTVTSVSYTASTTVTTLAAMTTRGARRTIFNNISTANSPIYINKSASTTGTTSCIKIAAGSKDVDTLYMGVVYVSTSTAATNDFRVEEVKYNVY